MRNENAERFVCYSRNITHVQFRIKDNKQLLKGILGDVTAIGNVQITQFTAILYYGYCKLTR